jgi:hypothetical protein
MPDRIDHLIGQLLATSDPSFAPPPLDAAIAESVLGASGTPRTPHRRLLERANGAYLHDHALHLLGACAEPSSHSLAAWNAPATWRDAYGGLADGLVFFAEDAFGDQFAYAGRGGEVVCFEAELGRVVPVAASFADWLDLMAQHPASLLPLEVVAAQRAQGRPLVAGVQLFAYPPLFSPESQEAVDIGHVDAVEAMRFRGSLARQIRDLPVGTRVAIHLDGEGPK